jgi:hypothetical protein
MPLPALFGPLADRFIRAVRRFAVERDVTVIHFVGGNRHVVLTAHTKPYTNGVAIPSSRCGFMPSFTRTNPCIANVSLA